MAQYEVKAERGNWNGAGNLLEAVEVIEANVNPDNDDCNGLALEIIEHQMDRMKVGDRLAYNWACSVLDVIVERTA